MLNDTLNFLTWAAICAGLWLVPLPSHAAVGPVEAMTGVYGAAIIGLTAVLVIALHVSRRPL